ncbi:suppressor of SWI4 1 homolog [Syngnathus typhle]|uniref:suppressor of SWI4 1 homolog n=1 Tax=Syngnathus typhle TaxID=161592 RepID=UPI002A6A7D88|nr:suppressor of SWI4 1 homolog [Syngnathus typhle]
MGKSKTKNQKKSRAEAHHVAEESYRSVPHSFVFHRGQVGKNVAQLIMDVRRVMDPYTAEQLKVRKKNVLKDFVTVAGPIGVTHFIIFSKTPSSITMRLARLPKGPMLYFKVLKYTLVKDVVSSLKKHRMHGQQFTHHPLLILNNFGSDGMHIKLMATMFQNMFPSINVHKVSLNTIKRCVLLNYNQETQEIEFRHYSLKVVPVGMSRGVKKLMQEKFPNMCKFEDISELMIKGANLSESEAEQDGEHNITELPQVYSGRGNMASEQSAIRLTEIGPRMTLQLVKIQDGMAEGNIMYHSTISKTEEEILEILQRKEDKMKAREARRKKQEKNVAQKKLQKEEHKKKSLAGLKKKQGDEDKDSEVEDPGAQDDRAATAVESDDEAEYYRQAVGEEPDEDMFVGAKRRRSNDGSRGPAKKMRKPYADKASSREKGTKGSSPGGHYKDKPAKKFADREKKFVGKKTFGKKSSPGGKPFKNKQSAGENRSGNKNKFEGKRTFSGKTNNGKAFQSKSKKSKAPFNKKSGGGAKQGFKRKKGKG